MASYKYQPHLSHPRQQVHSQRASPRLDAFTVHYFSLTHRSPDVVLSPSHSDPWQRARSQRASQRLDAFAVLDTSALTRVSASLICNHVCTSNRGLWSLSTDLQK